MRQNLAEIIIGTVFPFVSTQTVHLSDHPNECFEYLPILETINAVAGVHKLLAELKKCCETPLRDIYNDSYFKGHSMLKNATNEKLLALQLYFDEFLMNMVFPKSALCQ